MARVIKSKVKIKELPDKWKIVKKEESEGFLEDGEEDEEGEEQEQGLEQTTFIPRARSSGLEAPVLEASANAPQSQFTEGRERKKEDTNGQRINAPEYQTSMVYNMPDYSPSRQQARQQTRTEAVIHPTLAAADTSQRQTVRMQEWGELSQARGASNQSQRQEAVIGASQLAQDNKLPFQQDSKYHPRKRTI